MRKLFDFEDLVWLQGIGNMHDVCMALVSLRWQFCSVYKALWTTCRPANIAAEAPELVLYTAAKYP